ncbi:MAG: hypothetical protein GY943_30585 [Chloroflexi bacterium]|nr:hypothetical protein [Chloroflexota bacterium]
MAITNYGELKTAVSEHVGETLTSVVVDLVTMAQDHLSTELRHRRMITNTDLSPTAGEFTLPADYKWHHRCVELASTRRNLDYITPVVADEIYPSRPAGLGINYTIEGNLLRVYPTITNDIELVYYADFAAFSGDSDTDWLLTKQPLLYLRTCELMAAEYLKDDEEYAKHSAVVNRLIAKLNIESDLAHQANAGINFSGYVA